MLRNVPAIIDNTRLTTSLKSASYKKYLLRQTSR